MSGYVIEFAARGVENKIHNFNDANQLPAFYHKPDAIITFSPGKPGAHNPVTQYGHYISNHDMRHLRLGRRLQALYNTNDAQLNPNNHHGSILRKLENNKKSARPIRGAKILYTN
jgi:hypothetical protein